MRSLLFVPGNQPRMLDKARRAPADAVILDLEDAVPLNQKAEARAAIRRTLQEGGFGPYVAVRVNGFGAGLIEEDLKATLNANVRAICLPKAQSPADVARLASLLESLESDLGMPAGSVGVLLLVETALGVLHAFEMGRASARVRALCLGGEDLCRDLGAVRTPEGLELAYARASLVVAARAAGILAIDTVYTRLDDQVGLLAESRQARQLGYSGKLLIHPNQIEAVHQAFAPSEEEIAHARRVLAAFETAGAGVCLLDGVMIDAPVVARARQTLAQSARHDGEASR